MYVSHSLVPSLQNFNGNIRWNTLERASVGPPRTKTSTLGWAVQRTAVNRSASRTYQIAKATFDEARESANYTLKILHSHVKTEEGVATRLRLA